MRYCATASSHFPWLHRTTLRLLWAAKSSGWSRIRLAVFGDGLIRHSPGAQGEAKVVVNCGAIGLEPDRLPASGDGAVEDRRRGGGLVLLPQVNPQAAQVSHVVRPSIRQVVEDHLGLDAAAHPLEQVGHVVSRLGSQRAGCRVVAHRFLTGRRAQVVQGRRQGVVDPNVAGVAAGRGAEEDHGGLGLAEIRQGLAEQDGSRCRELGRLGGGRQGLQRQSLGLAVLGQEDRAQSVAIRLRVGQPRRLHWLSPGGDWKTGFAAHG